MLRSATALIFAATALLFAQSSYRVTHTYPLGGEGSWDYVVPDPPNHRVFIARQNRVMVVDEDTGKLIGEVTGIQGAHGTAIAESTGHGFATSGNDESVVMFDSKTFIVSAREGRWFWSTMPSKTLAAALAADALPGTVLTRVGIPGLAPLPWWQVLAIFGYAMVSCLIVNDALKVAMIRWRVPLASG